MDFQKAFDKVPHKRLLEKMKGYGLGPQINNWVESFLANRSHKVCVNGKFSNEAPVTSGIPQGSVLGPTLFTLFINDLPDEVESTVYLFADDTKIFGLANNKKDTTTIQDDLNRLDNWSKKWLLSFHPGKCKVLKLGNKNNTHEEDYYLDGTKLEETACEKDLGVYVDNKLNFEEHIDQKIKKGNQIMGIIRRSFRHLNKRIFKKLFTSMVRPHIEYAAPTWNPHQKQDIRRLESVQRRGTKQVPDLKNMSYKERLQALDLPTLAYRRMRGDLIETYKIVNGKYDPIVTELLPRHKAQGTVTRGHQLKLQKPSYTKDLGKFFFTRRVVDTWNNLPASIVEAPSVNSFKNRIDTHWKSLDIKYDIDLALQKEDPFTATGGDRYDLLQCHPTRR